MNIEQLINHAHEVNASDVHLVCGLPVKFRVNGGNVQFFAHFDSRIASR